MRHESCAALSRPLGPALLEIPAVTEWFDTDEGVAQTSAAGRVSQWKGRKAQSNFAEATAGNQPSIAAGLFGTRLGIYFNGAAYRLVHDTAWNTFMTTNLGSIYILLKPVAITLNTGNPLTDNSIFATNDTRLSLGMDTGSGGTITAGLKDAGGYKTSGTTPHQGLSVGSIVTWRHSGGKVGVRTGASAFVESTGAAIDATGGFLRLGTNYDSTTWSNIYVGAVVFANADLTASQDLRILSALSLWGGGVAL